MSYLYVYSPCCCSSNWQKNGKNKFLFYYSPSHIFQKKKIKFLLFGRIFLFFFLFSSIQEKHFCEQTPVLLVFFALYLSLSLKKLFRIFKMNLSEFLCFSLLKFFSTFFRHFYFCSSRFPFTSFFISFYVWIFLISFFLNSVSLPSLSSFFWTTISLVYQKTLQLSLFTCMRSLCMSLCSYICSSVVSFSLFVFSRFLYICFPFPSFVSLSTTSLKDKLKELLQIWKKTCLSIYLFVGHFFQIYLSLHKALWRTRLHIQWDMWCPSFLLYFLFFVTSFLKHIFYEMKLWMQFLLFVYLFVCALLCSHFCWFFQQQNKFRYAIFLTKM